MATNLLSTYLNDIAQTSVAPAPPSLSSQSVPLTHVQDKVTVDKSLAVAVPKKSGKLFLVVGLIVFICIVATIHILRKKGAARPTAKAHFLPTPPSIPLPALPVVPPPVAAVVPPLPPPSAAIPLGPPPPPPPPPCKVSESKGVVTETNPVRNNVNSTNRDIPQYFTEPQTYMEIHMDEFPSFLAQQMPNLSRSFVHSESRKHRGPSIVKTIEETEDEEDGDSEVSVASTIVQKKESKVEAIPVVSEINTLD